MFESIRTDNNKQVILFEMLIILIFASMYYNLAFEKKTDILYQDCNLIQYQNATKTGVAICTRAFTQAFDAGYDIMPVTITNLSHAYPIRETVQVLAGGADYCTFKLCPNNDPVCLSVRLLNVTISNDRRTECEKLNDVCYNHGGIKCHRLTAPEKGCKCQE